MSWIACIAVGFVVGYFAGIAAALYLFGQRLTSLADRGLIQLTESGDEAYERSRRKVDLTPAERTIFKKIGGGP